MEIKKKNQDQKLKDNLAKDLRIWLSQSKYKSQKHFSDEVRINLKTLQGYFQGKKLPTVSNLTKLKEATNLKILDKIKMKETLSENSNIQDLTKAHKKAKKVLKLLNSLNKELEFFKKGKPQDRDIFRDMIPGENVGYIVTLIKALFNESQFQNWLFFTDQTLEEGKNE